MPRLTSLIPVLLAAGALTLQPSAKAGPYADDLSRCLVRSTTEMDRTTLVKWLFAMATLHPDVQSISSTSESQRDSLNKEVAALFEKLLTETCRTETQEAVKFEGPQTLEVSFQVLGQVAGRQLFSDPRVSGGMAGITKYIDRKKFEQLGDGAK